MRKVMPINYIISNIKSRVRAEALDTIYQLNTETGFYPLLSRTVNDTLLCLETGINIKYATNTCHKIHFVLNLGC